VVGRMGLHAGNSSGERIARESFDETSSQIGRCRHSVARKSRHWNGRVAKKVRQNGLASVCMCDNS
jgi:hypothetical protein